MLWVTFILFSVQIHNHCITVHLIYNKLNLLTYLLTYSMQHSPSWEANGFSAGQAIPCILWNMKVYYQSHIGQPPAPVPSQISPVHVLHPTSWKPTLLLSSHLHLGHPSGLFPSGFPTKTLYAPILSPYVLLAPSISFFSILSSK